MPNPHNNAHMLKICSSACIFAPPNSRMYDAPSGNSSTTVTPMMTPCAFLQFESKVGDGPTVELLPESESEFDDDGVDGEDDGEDADDEAELEALVVTEDETNGFESDDIDAAERSKVNWRMLVGPCMLSVYVSLVESMAFPGIHAQIQGEDVEVAVESSTHVVPGDGLAWVSNKVHGF